MGRLGLQLVANPQLDPIRTGKSRCISGSRSRLNSEIVVNGIPQSLFAPQIPFGRLHAHMSKQELDLLEFSPGLVT